MQSNRDSYLTACYHCFNATKVSRYSVMFFRSSNNFNSRSKSESDGVASLFRKLVPGRFLLVGLVLVLALLLLVPMVIRRIVDGTGGIASAMEGTSLSHDSGGDADGGRGGGVVAVGVAAMTAKMLLMLRMMIALLLM